MLDNIKNYLGKMERYEVLCCESQFDQEKIDKFIEEQLAKA
jgi:hypothetical protein